MSKPDKANSLVRFSANNKITDMGKTLSDRQKWLEHALQELAFWVGHRQSLYNAYALTEGALVAEACNLIKANLPPELILLPECQSALNFAP